MPIDYKEERRLEAADHEMRMLKEFRKEIDNSVEKAELCTDSWCRKGKLPNGGREWSKTAVIFLQDKILKAASMCFEDREALDFNHPGIFEPWRVAIVVDADHVGPFEGYMDGELSSQQQICSRSTLWSALKILEDECCGIERDMDEGCSNLRSEYRQAIKAAFIPGIVFESTQLDREARSFAHERHMCDAIVVVPPDRLKPLSKGWTTEDVVNCMKSRIDAMMRLAAKNHVDTLVISPLGVERNGWSYEESASLLRDWIRDNADRCPVRNILLCVPGHECHDVVDVFENGLSMLMHGLANYRGYITLEVSEIAGPDTEPDKSMEDTLMERLSSKLATSASDD